MCGRRRRRHLRPRAGCQQHSRCMVVGALDCRRRSFRPTGEYDGELGVSAIVGDGASASVELEKARESAEGGRKKWTSEEMDDDVDDNDDGERKCDLLNGGGLGPGPFSGSARLWSPRNSPIASRHAAAHSSNSRVPHAPKA